MVFLDQSVIRVKAGDGGDGLVSFRRERGVPKGGPDGGNGGRGGDVFLVASDDLNGLNFFASRKDFVAQSGEAGRSKNQTGRDGYAIKIEVPVGTIVREFRGDLKSLIADLVSPLDQVVVAKGGEGGRGNASFKSSTNQTPKVRTKGWLGEQKTLELELKLIAEVGIIGLPNVGKSSLLSKISAATPKIADYRFTTLEPNLGLVDFASIGLEKRAVWADIPGLIEGASAGKGLGHDFLRHIERTKALVHLLDSLSDNLELDYQAVRKELLSWSPDLLKKPVVVVINRIDLDSRARERHRAFIASRRAILISAFTGQGLGELLSRVAKVLETRNSRP